MTGHDQSGVRGFVALLLDTAVLDELQAYQKLLRKQITGDALRWARLDQLHLTLRFLGAVPESAVALLGDKLQRSAAMHQPFKLHLGMAGAFPDVRRARVIWVGLGGALDRLAALQAEVERAVGAHSPHQEARPFQAHLTLARLRPGGIADPAWAEGLGQARGPQPVAWMVRELHLMRSELHPQGARYTVLRSLGLGLENSGT